jgi:hypothetical protein
MIIEDMQGLLQEMRAKMKTRIKKYKKEKNEEMVISTYHVLLMMEKEGAEILYWYSTCPNIAHNRLVEFVEKYKEEAS